MPHRLRREIAGHETATVGYMGWAGLKNGTLIGVAEASAFDVLVTGDRTLYYEQKLSGRKIAIVCLSCIDWLIMRPHLAAITAAIDNATPGSFQEVHCGTFSRKKPRD